MKRKQQEKNTNKDDTLKIPEKILYEGEEEIDISPKVCLFYCF